MGVSVTGGVGGIEACLEDLAVLSQLLHASAETVTAAGHAAEFGRLEIGGCGGLDFGANNHRLDQLLTDLSSPTAAAKHTIDDLQTLAALVKIAASEYRSADQSVFDMVASSILSLPGALLKSGERLLTTGSVFDAEQQFLTADPELVDLLVEASGGELEPIIGMALTDDGHPVVRDAYNDVEAPAVTPPQDVGDLITALSERNDGASGEISVSFVYGIGDTRHVIVDIPGTKSWSPLDTSDVTSLATNFRAIIGGRTSYEDGVLQAMHDAGVTNQDDVMLVGHSEGGMIAVNAARDSIGTFHVTHVVTAGAPIGRLVGQLPRSIQVLALEDRGDLVPRLDGVANPDSPNVTTVHGGPDHGSIGDNHDLDDSYLPLAQATDHSHDVSIRNFTGTARDFFDQERMTTERYVITRAY